MGGLAPRDRLGLVVGGLVLVTLLVAGAASAETGDQRVVVGLEDVPETLDRESSYEGYPVVDLNRPLEFVVVEASSVQDVREDTDEGNVTYVEKDRMAEVLYKPDDPRFDDQYGPNRMDAQDAWDVTLGDEEVAVCVVDSGLRKSHVEFPSDRILGDRDFYHNDGSVEDHNGHGTHVTGIAAAELDNNDLVAGLGNVGIYSAESMRPDGRGYHTDIADGIVWCADRDVPTVINLSLGGSGSSTMKKAVRYAWNHGSLIVAAAGNDGCGGCVNYPAKYSQAIAVSCTDWNNDLCYFSSYGGAVEFAAPGRDILNTGHNGDRDLTQMSGTSMSSPHVAGAAAVAWSLRPELDNEDIRERMRNHVKDLGPSGRDNRYGYGLLDMGSLVRSIERFDAPRKVDRWTFDQGVPSTADATGLWHADDMCQTPHSKPLYIGYHRTDECSYATGRQTRGSFTLPVDLRGVYIANLTFHHRWDVEETGMSSADRMHLEASTDGGQSWQQLARWSSASGDTFSWQRFDKDLGGDLLGNQILLRWTFDSDDGMFNEDEGWLIDDVHVHGITNKIPDADAGPDRLVADDDANGEEPVTLNASASQDPEQSIVAYRWYLDGSEIATGEVTQASLPVGTHEVTLEVVDDENATDHESLTATVEANKAPTASASDVTVSDADASGDELLTLDASASSDPDGSVTAYEWTKDGTLLATGATPEITLDVGTHPLQVTITDNGGAQDSVDVTVIVQPNREPDAVAKDEIVKTDAASANVTLDGTGSEDPDGSIQNYTWTEDGTVIATGPSPTVELDNGEHNITLTVDDTGNGTATDEAWVPVMADLPPVAQAGQDRTVHDDDADGTETLRVGALLETGRVGVQDSSWTSIGFRESFEQPPVVLAQAQTENGGSKALYGEARSVNRSDAQIRYCEHDEQDLCDNHAEETVAWMALPQGTITEGTSRLFEAGLTPALDDGSSKDVAFSEAFEQAPTLFATTQTVNGDQDPSSAHTWEIDKEGFRTRHCEIDFGTYGSIFCDNHARETNGWLAVDDRDRPGLETGTVQLQDHQTHQITFDEELPTRPLVFAQLQTRNGHQYATAHVLSVTKTGATIELCEPDANNGCESSHTTETVAWMAIEPVLAGITSGDLDGNLTDATWYEDGTKIADGTMTKTTEGLGEHTYVLEVTDDANQTRNDNVTITIEPNQAPLADAGPDQVAHDVDGNDTESFSLDATGSTDPDGDVTSYTWTLDGTAVATGPTPQVWLPVGEHTLELTVDDNGNGTATDQVNLTVEPNQAPLADGYSEPVRDEDGSGDEQTPLVALNSSDPDGSVTTYEWTLDGSVVATGADTSATLPVGTNSLTLTVTDNGGATDSITVDTEVNPNRPPNAVMDVNCVLTVCELIGSASTDPDTAVEEFDWRVDGETVSSLAHAEEQLPAYNATDVQLQVTDSGGAQDSQTQTMRLDTPGVVQPPTSPPEDPLIEENQPSLRIVWYPPRPHVSAAWFDFDASHVYVGLDANVIYPPSQTTAGQTFSVSAEHTWTPSDPTWGGVKPAGHSVQGLRVHATGPTVESPLQESLELQLVTTDVRGQTTYHTITDLQGTVNPENDIVWWMVPRAAMQVPTDGGTLTNVKATVDAPFQPSQTRGADRPVEIPPGDRYGLASLYHAFSSGTDAFERENEQPASEVRWDPTTSSVLVHSDRIDTGDERLVRQLPQTLDANTSFTLTAHWDLTVRGHWQYAFPVYLSDDETSDLFEEDSSLFVWYRGRDPSFGHPHYQIRYKDASEETQIALTAEVPPGQDPTFVMHHNATSQELTVAVLAPFDHIRAQETYTLGTSANDGFTFTELGVASQGRALSYENPARGYTDDLQLYYETATG